MQRVPIERFQWPLMFALILLLGEFAISDRKRNRQTFPVIKTAYRRIPKIGRVAGTASIAALVLVAIVLLGYRSAHASPGNAEAAYKSGNYDVAVEGYRSETLKTPEDPQLQFNLGAAAYKGKKYPEALAAFGKALSVQDIAMQNQSYYNMGNTLYRRGEGTEKQNPQQTIKNWEASIQAYDNALKLNPEDPDATFNREFVKKRLEALKKGQKDNKKDCNKCDNKDNKDPRKDNQKKDNQNKDNKDNQQAKNQEPRPNKNKDQNPKQNRNNNSQDPKSAQNQKDQQDQGDGAARALERRRPGQMTEEQAKNLLDSLKGDEKAMPMTAQNMGMGGKPQDRKRRDW